MGFPSLPRAGLNFHFFTAFTASSAKSSARGRDNTDVIHIALRRNPYIKVYGGNSGVGHSRSAGPRGSRAMLAGGRRTPGSGICLIFLCSPERLGTPSVLLLKGNLNNRHLSSSPFFFFSPAPPVPCPSQRVRITRARAAVSSGDAPLRCSDSASAFSAASI